MTENLTQKQGLCVVIDTNVWVYETRMLRSPLGAALLYEVHDSRAKIGLPEVVELEIIKHFVKEGLKAIDNISKGYETIEILVGSRDDFRVPNKDDLERSASDRLQQLEGIFHRVPLTLAHAKGSLLRIMDETPPNSFKNQQFKDSCIWEAILDLSNLYDVHFITMDKSFFEKGDPKKGVANQLMEDIDRIGKVIKVHFGIEEFLNEIRQQRPAFDKDKVEMLIGNEILKTLPESETQDWVEIGSIIGSKIEAFLTEDHNQLAISFSVDFSVTLRDLDSNSEFGGKAVIEGECSLNVETSVISNIQFESIGTYRLDGTKLKRSVYIHEGIVYVGRRTVPYRMKIPVRLV